MTGTNEAEANILCKACGLCCTGHLFIRTKLRPVEMDSARELGLNVLRSDPRQRGFSQPCPLWQGKCTIYGSPHYPRFCGTYKCKLLREMINESVTLSEALTAIAQAKEMIGDLKARLPASSDPNFRERLVAHLETLEQRKTPAGQTHSDAEFQQKANRLLAFYDGVFGVNDLIDPPDEE